MSGTDNPLVSIIIPVYNSAKYLNETIRTVKNQTYKNWEIIFIDDCSTDESPVIISENVSPKIRYYRLKKNSGAAQARNAGINAANGRFICFLDADDLWDKTKLEAQTLFMLENGYAFTFTDYEYARPDGSGTGVITKIPDSLTYFNALKNTVIFTSTVMLDVSKIKKEDILMPDVPYEDTATWWKILKKYGKAYGLKKNLTRYRRSGGKTLSSNKLTGIKRAWNLYRRVEGFSVIKSAYYFTFYAYNAVLRRIKK